MAEGAMLFVFARADDEVSGVDLGRVLLPGRVLVDVGIERHAGDAFFVGTGGIVGADREEAELHGQIEAAKNYEQRDEYTNDKTFQRLFLFFGVRVRINRRERFE